MTDYLSYEDVLEVASEIVSEGLVADAGLLASAVLRPQITVLGAEAYATVEEKAAALQHGIARNHALIDGNKRLAWATVRVFLLMNGYTVNNEVHEAEVMVVATASGHLR